VHHLLLRARPVDCLADPAAADLSPEFALILDEAKKRQACGEIGEGFARIGILVEIRLERDDADIAAADVVEGRPDWQNIVEPHVAYRADGDLPLEAFLDAPLPEQLQHGHRWIDAPE